MKRRVLVVVGVCSPLDWLFLLSMCGLALNGSSNMLLNRNARQPGNWANIHRHEEHTNKCVDGAKLNITGRQSVCLSSRVSERECLDTKKITNPISPSNAWQPNQTAPLSSSSPILITAGQNKSMPHCQFHWLESFGDRNKPDLDGVLYIWWFVLKRNSNGLSFISD